MEACLCNKCLNPHALYNCIRKHLNDLPLSLTEYLTSNFECDDETDISYPHLKCIDGNCDEGCRITDESRKRCYD